VSGHGGWLHGRRLEHVPHGISACWVVPRRLVWVAVLLTVPIQLLALSGIPFIEGPVERVYPYRYLVDTGDRLAVVLPWDAKQWERYGEPVPRVLTGSRRWWRRWTAVRFGEVELVMSRSCAAGVIAQVRS
jgi:hypothetical protein